MQIRANFRAEQDRWPLWLPVALGGGAAGYFACAFEPPAAAGWVALGLGLLLAVIAAAGWARPALALAAALLLGFGAAKLREEAVATPVLTHAVIVHLTGRIVSLEPRRTGTRLVLDHLRSGALDPAPLRARITVRGKSDGLAPGLWTSLTASLAPPSPPVEPGAADYGRSEFFQSIGAAGFAYGRARPIVAAETPGWTQRTRARVEALRLAMTQRIRTRLPGSAGGIAAALITGNRGEISEDDEQALRDAGLAHVLAIAGLHMALVGGGLFWLVRAVLAAFPAVALNYPIKKWAALAALATAVFYLVISGAAAPAVRAFVMLACAMVAVLIDRPALTMRAVALAAAILLLTRPESITEPGFQMSFAAVASLVAVAEWGARRADAPPHGALYRYARGIAVTSLVGSLATLPFALFHFSRSAHYAVLGNLIAMPVMGFWVMPAAAVAVALMPLGWDGPALDILGAGIRVMLAMGRWVSDLPGAVSLSPAMPLPALVAISLGGLWLLIWRRRWRWLGLAPMLAGMAMTWTARGPDMLVAPDARTVVVRGDDGLLHFPKKPADKFVAQMWLERDGDGRVVKDATGIGRCDSYGCVVRRGGAIIALSLRLDALAEDCSRATVLVTPMTATCRGPMVVMDGKAALLEQGWAIRFQSLRVRSVRQERGDRPWVAQ